MTYKTCKGCGYLYKGRHPVRCHEFLRLLFALWMAIHCAKRNFMYYLTTKHTHF